MDPDLVSRHSVLFSDSRRMEAVADDSVDLIVTSPPYPMIEMWDEAFSKMSPDASQALEAGNGEAAFEACHRELDEVWRECRRVLRNGRFACINVGDAVRTIGGEFRLYSNHSRILSAMTGMGFTSLPDILWRKQTNAPNKFMGSGMLPAGAYVTYEHEYVLIFRKGGPRKFLSASERENRRRSAYFWEERNVWFSDVWTDLKGTAQALAAPEARSRSGAFPFELAYRLIAMLTVYGDTVLDPFLGTGTTCAAALASMRNSVGIEFDEGLSRTIGGTLRVAVDAGRERASRRLEEHRAFVSERLSEGKAFKHENARHDFPVITAQERDMALYAPVSVRENAGNRFEASHEISRGRDQTAKPGQLSLF